MSEGSYDGLLVSAGIECLNPGFFGFRPSMKASMNLTGFLCLSTGRWYWEIALFGLCGFRLRVRSCFSVVLKLALSLTVIGEHKNRLFTQSGTGSSPLLIDMVISEKDQLFQL
jgi:hypothetical protein